ncbi:MAG TPA: ribonuclease P protein component [Verrucomicrobiota bacterium]|nr:ribonuclease P protein component [Verrucomicrobiota bacterium]
MAANAPARLTLGRESRIKQSRDFSRLRREGQRTVSGCLIANWKRLPDGSRARVGVVVSGKVGGSVTRSRVRRLLRETFRLHQRDLSQPVDMVLVARPSIARQSLAGVGKDFLAALNKAGLLRNEEGRI